MSEQDQLGPSQDGSVMLDIGGDIGALILNASVDLAGAEIEISPIGQDSTRRHVAVRERRGPSGTRHAAIYPSLPAGEYTLWASRDTPATTVHIRGGEITQLDWTQPAPAQPAG